MPEHAIVHATFTLERRYPVARPRVFEAWADSRLKARWFAGDSSTGYELDFRPGGVERNRGEHDGKRIGWESLYREIVPDERIVYTSVLSMDGAVASVSLTTVEFVDVGEETGLVLVEAGAFLDGWEKPEWREEGTSQWLDALARQLGTPRSA